MNRDDEYAKDLLSDDDEDYSSVGGWAVLFGWISLGCLWGYLLFRAFQI